MSDPDNRAKTAYSWLPYLVVGLSLCALLETVFYLELGAGGAFLLPFIWAYSQSALVELLLPSAGPPTWALQGITWFLFYVALSFALWVLVGRSSSHLRAIAWRRALLGWFAVELVLAIIAAGALYAGIIEME